MAHYISTVNLLKVAASLTASSQATGYEVSHLADPEYLFEPWRSTATTQQTIVVDHGASKVVDRVTLLDANFTLFRVEQNATNLWTTPTFTSGPLSIARDHYHRQYRRWYEPAPLTPLTLRWTRIVIPTQATTDGAAYFRLGGMHFGEITPLPRAPRPGYSGAAVDSRVTVEAEGGWYVQYEVGDPIVHQTWSRFAAIDDSTTPGLNDELGAWWDIDRVIAEAGGLFLHYVDLWGPGAAWMMRQTSENKWQDRESGHVQEDTWELVECCAG